MGKIRLLCCAVAAVPLLATLAAPAYAAAPGAPTGVGAAPGPGRTIVTWSPAADDGGAAATGYRVYRVADGGTPVLLTTTDAAARSYVDATAPVGPLLSYGVAQLNADGAGEAAYTAAERAPAAELVVSAPAGGTRDIEAQVPGGGVRFSDVHDALGRAAVTPAVSPDGAWLAYAKRVGDGLYSIYVRPADGTGAEWRMSAKAGADDREPAWSPDGRYLAFQRTVAGRTDVYTKNFVDQLPATRAFSSARHPSWLSDSRSLLAVSLTSPARRIVRWTRGSSAVTPLRETAYAAHLSVSPNGRWVAYTSQAGAGARKRLAVSPVSGSSAPVLLSDSADVYDPAWGGDGRVLFANRPFLGRTDVAAFSWDGRVIARTATTVTSGPDDRSPAYRAVGLGFVSPPLFTAATATVTFALPGPYAAATCRLDGGAATACSSGTWTASGLKAGPHTLVVTAARAGYRSRVLAHTFTVDLTAPTVVPQGRPGDFTFSWVHFGARASDPLSGVESFDIRYRRARWDSGFGAFVRPAGWQRTTPQNASAVGMDAPRGYTYCFSARARDHVGNLSGWSAERCYTTVGDDAVMHASPSWERVTSPAYYQDTATRTETHGATLTLPDVEARSLYLYAWQCPACGRVAVYHGGVLLGRFDLADDQTRQVIFALRDYAQLRGGPLKVVVTSPTGRLVRVDGFIAMRRWFT